MTNLVPGTKFAGIFFKQKLGDKLGDKNEY